MALVGPANSGAPGGAPGQPRKSPETVGYGPTALTTPGAPTRCIRERV